MRPSTRLVCFAVLAGSGFARAQEADDASSRAEKLEAFIKQSVASASASPAVLADFDAKRADAASRKAALALQTTKVGFNLSKVPLEDALTLFAKVSGVSFTLTAKAREAAKSKETKVTILSSELPLENVLNLLMEQLPDYRFAVRYGAVVCMLKEEHKPKTVLVIYDVTDVVRPRPDFPAPKLGLSGIEEKR